MEENSEDSEHQCYAQGCLWGCLSGACHIQRLKVASYPSMHTTYVYTCSFEYMWSLQ